MATLPSSSSFTGSSVTEADFKAAITQLRDFLSGIVGTGGTQITALQALGALLSNRVDKSTNYTVVAGDRGKLIRCTAALTLSLTAAASLGEGFACAVKNEHASADVTIDPNLSEEIDGVSSVALSPGESAILYCTGTAWVTVARSVGGDGELREVRYYPGAQSANWVKPAGLKRVRVYVQGGGGGGSYGNTTTAGGSGGSGGYAEKLIEAASLGSNETVTAGAGGISGTSGSTNGGNGGTSSFGAHVSCVGGSGGQSNGTPGAGGAASGGDMNIDGQPGGGGGTVASNAPYGHGGGSSRYGGGGARRMSSSTTGIAASGYGAGGGAGTSANGGGGSPGLVIVEEYY